MSHVVNQITTHLLYLDRKSKQHRHSCWDEIFFFEETLLL